jgi:hypothetical protein
MPILTMPDSAERTIEQRRALLRKALVLRPDDNRVMPALRTLLTPEYVHESAEKGVFMAYHRADASFALDLTMDLRDAGVNIWMDEVDVVGDDWGKEVQSALKLSGVLLYVLSPSSVQDPDLKRQHNYFLGSGKIIVPLIQTSCDTNGLRLDYPPLDFRREYAHGVKQVLRLFQPEAEVNAPYIR